MKKHLLLFAIACMAFGISTSYGQATFGVKAGANLANANFDTGSSLSVKPDAIIGFYAGPTARFDVSSRFAIQPELLLSLQGFKWEFDFETGGEDVGFDATFQNLYLNLPVMARFSATEALHLEAGPQVGLLLSSKVKNEDVSVDWEENNELDFGLNIGAGYQLPMGLSVEARYNFGLANIFGDMEDDNTSVTNRVLSLGLGYTF
ncbi:outer membrane protein with beta-barrel domain [Anseongella ginsenosidimutans]|uniref:Outer membrane protein with beta-barrel domain n=1 Tax=Anseongella ginsenosidimutans TaxID=496056 RepID=A0A4R3KWM4_9SPHI|nr:porin family protein [Anseongella ginsenosidimutans]QEC51134.1 PorT family protein [Anseongella ginsenosidimutans]TCS90197.1 outer membrane protein with beta-barrel domain [Anseongella ginsenosidimutans]